VAERAGARRVLVTGASSGIGAAVAAKLTARGDTVAICARRAARLAEVPAAFRYTADVADLASLEALAARAEADLGAVDVLINNAGAPRRRRMQHITLDEFHETMRVNFWSAVHLTHALLPGMVERGGGVVVNVSSMGTRSLAVRTGAYTAAKGALNHYTEALHLDLVGTGVVAKLFIPGSTATEFSTPKDGNDAPFPQDPAGIMGADEVADALLAFLETDDFEGYADPRFGRQTATKYADHPAFIARAREMYRPR
jgi:short-subunit dehydrogenase